jgi:hypothetical protein
MFNVGDVVRCWSDTAGKKKYHLCISLAGHFLFLNSPKKTSYPGDLVVSCAEIPFLPPTHTGASIVSCTLVLRFTDNDLRAMNAVRVGTVSPALLRKIARFVQDSPVLTDEQRDVFLDAIGDWA